MVIKSAVLHPRLLIRLQKQTNTQQKKAAEKANAKPNLLNFICLVTIILCFLSFGCAPNQPPVSSPPPQNTAKNMIRVWTTLPAEWTQTALDAYLKDNPQEEIEFQVIPVNDENLQSLKQLPLAERPHLLFASSEELSAITDDHVLTAVVTENSDMLPPGLHDENYYWTGIWADPYVVVVNREYSRQVGQIALASWQDILFRTKSTMAICDPFAVPETAAFFFSWASRNGDDGKMFDELSALHALTKQYSRFASTPVKLVGIGDSNAAITLSSTFYAHKDKQYPLYACRPEPGGPVRLLGVALVQVEAQDKEKYISLIDWLLELQSFNQRFETEKGVLSVRQVVEDPDLLERWWFNTQYLNQSKQQLFMRNWLERVRFGK